MKKTIYIGAIALGMFATACSDSQPNTVAETTPVSVTTAKAGYGTNTNTWHSSGSIEALQQATISTRMAGFVDKIAVKSGDQVQKGALLIRINSKDLQAKEAQVKASIKEAQAALAIAQKDFQRYKALYKQESVSLKEWEDMQTHYEMAQARLEAAQAMEKEVAAQFSYSDIRAPFSGVVHQKFINEGDMAHPGMPLLVVESEGQHQVVSSLGENEISKVHTGMPVQVYVKSLGKEFSGKVSEISQSTQHAGTRYQVKIRLDDTNEQLLTGMYCQVSYSEATKENASVYIPTEALVHRGQLTGVYCINANQTAQLRWLRTGKTEKGMTEILSGLTAGEAYVLSASEKLYNGLPLQIQ